jgi:hypothetical protein
VRGPPLIFALAWIEVGPVNFLNRPVKPYTDGHTVSRFFEQSLFETVRVQQVLIHHAQADVKEQNYFHRSLSESARRAGPSEESYEIFR